METEVLLTTSNRPAGTETVTQDFSAPFQQRKSLSQILRIHLSPPPLSVLNILSLTRARQCLFLGWCSVESCEARFCWGGRKEEERRSVTYLWREAWDGITLVTIEPGATRCTRGPRTLPQFYLPLLRPSSQPAYLHETSVRFPDRQKHLVLKKSKLPLWKFLLQELFFTLWLVRWNDTRCCHRKKEFSLFFVNPVAQEKQEFMCKIGQIIRC